MANKPRKPLIEPGTVIAPGSSLVENIIKRDRAATGRARTTDGDPDISENIARNISDPEQPPGSSIVESEVHDEPRADGGASSSAETAIVGSRPRVSLTTITVRIPTDLNQWVDDTVAARRADGVKKQDVIASALRLLQQHEASQHE